ncbi:MAG: helix-turn-helix transcriptional regulator [Acidobacteriota bacterium]
MRSRPIASVLPTAYKALCAVLGWDPGEFARALGLSRSTLWRIEADLSELTAERQAAANAILGVTDEEIEAAVHLVTLVAERQAREAAGSSSPGATRRRARIAKELNAAVRDARAFLEAQLRAIEVEEAKEDAARLWHDLAADSAGERKLAVETCDEFLTPAFIARLCEESVNAAPRRAKDAVELADLALQVAERAPGTERRRANRLRQAWAFVANGHRVSNAFGKADAAFARSREIRPEGPAEEPEFFDPARPLDLEASLRRNQGRHGEALVLLEQALEVCWPASRSRLLLIQAVTWEQEGEPEKALAALEEARPAIERGEGGPRSRRVLWFNQVKNLIQLGRPGEAAELLPELRLLAIDDDLDTLRVRWLAAVVEADLGRRSEALVELRAVRREFAARSLPVDAALAGLYEAQVLLAEARHEEIRALVQEMRPIFDALGLERESLAAVRLFLEAVKRDAATAAMARDAARALCRLPRRA